MGTLVSARQVYKSFPVQRGFLGGAVGYVRAVDGVDIELNEDEVVALVGESGCGKTTLGFLLADLTEPTRGAVEWHGRPLAAFRGSEWQQFRRQVQVVFQDPYASLNPRLTVAETLRRPLRLHRIVVDRELDAEAARLLEKVGLRPANLYLDRYPHEFSGGQRQRIAIARALAVRPRVLIADEPVSALDVSIRAQILHLLNRLRREFGLSMLIMTHDLGVVRYVADRVAVMYLGRIVEEAATRTLYGRPRHPYTRMLLGSAPSFRFGARPAPQMLEPVGDPSSAAAIPSGCRFRTRCPLAFDRCTVEDPALREVDARHWVACHLDDVDQGTVATL